MTLCTYVSSDKKRSMVQLSCTRRSAVNLRFLRTFDRGREKTLILGTVSGAHFYFHDDDDDVFVRHSAIMSMFW